MFFKVSGGEDQEDEIYASDSSGYAKRALRKTISLPADAMRSKPEVPVKTSSPAEAIANLESRLEDIKKTKDVLEEERVGLLDTICKQDQQVWILLLSTGAATNSLLIRSFL